jgi:hypothetical protein
MSAMHMRLDVHMQAAIEITDFWLESLCSLPDNYNVSAESAVSIFREGNGGRRLIGSTVNHK